VIGLTKDSNSCSPRPPGDKRSGHLRIFGDPRQTGGEITPCCGHGPEVALITLGTVVAHQFNGLVFSCREGAGCGGQVVGDPVEQPRKLIEGIGKRLSNRQVLGFERLAERV
jgi:hypothetical protein